MSGVDSVALAAAAEALVGCPFRLHGRDPATGLDCVGVLALALREAGAGADLPGDYAMKMRDVTRFTARAGDFGFAAVAGAVAVGDVLLFRPGVCQYHFVIAARHGGFVQAHAGMRRVILSPSLPGWPLEGHWRLADAT